MFTMAIIILISHTKGMKKIIFSLVFILSAAVAFCQIQIPPVRETSPRSIIGLDQRKIFGLTFGYPTLATPPSSKPSLLNGGPDSIGVTFFVKSDSSIYVYVGGNSYKKVASGISGVGTINLDSLRDAISVTIVNLGGTSALIKRADESKAGVIAAVDQAKINKVNFANSYTQLTTFGSYDTKVVYQYRYNGTADNLYYSPGSTATADSAMVFSVPGGRLIRYIPGYIDGRWFGIVGDGVTDNSAAMQKAINAAINNGVGTILKIPAGTFLVKNLVVYHKTASEYDFVSVSIEGTTPTHSTNGNVTIFKTYDTACAILHIMSGRNISIKNIAFIGPGVYPPTIKQTVEWTTADWLSGNLRNNKYSPLAGINIDPFFYSVSAPNQYAGMSAFYSNTLARATSQVTFTNCSWAGFPAAFVVGVNGYTQNCDNIRIEGGTQVGNMNFWVSGQNQSRDNVIQNMYSLGQTRTFINCTDYGSNQGTPPSLYDVSIAGGTKYLYQFNGPFAGFSMHGGHIESLFALGVGGDLPVNFFGTEIKLEVPTVTFTSPTVAEGSGPVNFYGGSLEWFDNYLSEGWVFNTTAVNFNGTKVTGGTVVNKVYRNGWTSFNGVPYKNIYGQNTLWQAKDIFGTDQSIYSGFYVIPGMKIKNTNFIDDAGSWTSESIDNQIENQLIESATVVVDSTNHSGYFRVADPNKYQLYEDIVTTTAIDDPSDIFTANGYSHLGFISAISGDTIKIAYVPYGVINNSSYTIYISRIPKYFGRSFGDVTSGSKNILHVQGNYWHATNHIKGAGIPIGAYVTAVSGDTVKISVAATASGTSVELRDAKMLMTSNVKYAGIYHKGDIVYSQVGGAAQDTVWAEVCTQAGYFTGSPVPTFKEIKFGGSSGGGGGTPYTIGARDSLPKSLNGAVIAGSKVVMQSADGTYPGLVNTSSQTFAGAKIFNNNVSLPSFTMGTALFTTPGSSSFKVASSLGTPATFGVLLAGNYVFFDNDADGGYYFRSAGTAYYDMVIEHTAVNSLVPFIASSTLLATDSARFATVRDKEPGDSILYIHDGVLRKGDASELGYTIAQIRDSLQLDTTWHSRSFQSTTATTFNVDTIYFTGAINETLRITCEMMSTKSDGSSYQATRSMSYTITSAGSITDGSPQTDRPKQLVGLSTYDFTLTRTGGRMFIQCTSEAGTINGTIWYQVQRQKH